MKAAKIIMAALIAICIMAAGKSYAQKSTYYSGDKGNKEIAASVRIMDESIADLRTQVNELENVQEKLHRKYSKDTSDTFHRKIIHVNDSLLNAYRRKLNTMEEQKISFISAAASKDKQEIIQFASRNGFIFQNGVSSMKYVMGKSNESGGTEESGLIGIVENAGFVNPVIVKVTGPANFYRQFTLKGKSKSPEFTLPCLGSYTTTFTNDREVRCVTTIVAPNRIYYDGEKKYALKATLLP